MAVEQQQSHPLNDQLGGSRAETTAQHRLQQQRVIVVAGQQADGNVDVTIQQASQADVAAPALVLAEITADQQQIGTFALPLQQSSFQQRKGGPFPHQGRIGGHQMGVTQLQDPHGSREWTANH